MSDDDKFQTEDHAVEVVAAGLDALDPARTGPRWQLRPERTKEAWRAQARKKVRALMGPPDAPTDGANLVGAEDFGDRVAAQVAERLMSGDVGPGGAGLPQRIAYQLDEIHEEREADRRGKALANLRDQQEHDPIQTAPRYGLYAGPQGSGVNAGERASQIEAAESRGELALGDCAIDAVAGLPPSVRRGVAAVVLAAAGYYGSDLSTRAVTAIHEVATELEGAGVASIPGDPQTVAAGVRTLAERYEANRRELGRVERARRRTLPLMGIGSVLADGDDATYHRQQRSLIDAARVNGIDAEVVQAVVSTYLRSMHETEDAGE